MTGDDPMVNDATPLAPWRIGVDVGGTFTDLVLADTSGSRWVAKVPSVPADPSRGVLDAVAAVADRLTLSPSELLADCELFVHGSTVATNTLLEGKGAKVGLITSEGFRDSLEIRRGLRDDQWNHREPYAPVLVPRYLRAGVGGRIDAQGDELEPIATADIDRAVDLFEAEGVEAVAVALLNSFVDDGHEQSVGEAVQQKWSGRWISRSAEVSPLMGEYERTSTAVINAALSPGTVSYLEALDAELATLGLANRILLVQSNGGSGFSRAGRAPPGQPAAQRPGCRRRGVDPLSKRERLRPRWRGSGDRRRDLDGDRRHLLRCDADVRRAGGHP